MTCDDYQIAFDRTAEVDAHVATCAECTSYVALSRKLSTSMSNTLALAPNPPSLDAMRERVTQLRRQTARASWLMPALVGASLLAGARSTHDFVARLISAVLVCSIAYFVLDRLARRRIAQLAGLEQRSGGELVAGLRRQIDRELRNLRDAPWLMPLLVVAMHLVCIGARVPVVADWPYLMIEIVALAAVPYALWRRHRLLRERAVLAA